VEAGERDELEFVPHGAELALKAGDRRVVEMLLPIERRRAIVGKHLPREARVDTGGELSRLVKVRRRSFAPDEIGIRRVGEPPRDRHLDAALDSIEALGRALSRAKFPVAWIDVRGEKLALSASVRAMTSVGTSITSAAKRAAISVRWNWPVGMRTFPPRWPHFFSDES
jgi:hypothetical protein